MQDCLLLHCAAWDSETDDFQKWETPKEVWGQTNWRGLSHFQPLPVRIEHIARVTIVICWHYINFRWDEELIELAQTWTPKENSEMAIDYIIIEISEPFPVGSVHVQCTHITITFTVIFAADVKVTYDTYRNCMIGTCDQKTLIITNPGIYWFWVYAARMQILDVDC